MMQTEAFNGCNDALEKMDLLNRSNGCDAALEKISMKNKFYGWISELKL